MADVRLITTTNPKNLEQVLHDEIATDRNSYLPEDEKVKTYREYVGGKMNLVLTQEQQDILTGLLGEKFCFNLSLVTVGSARDRLKFLRWACEDATVNEWLEQFYTTSELESRQSMVHFDTLTDGDHVIALDWDTEAVKVRMYREKWWDGEEGVYIAYDTQDRMKYGVKDWLIPLYDDKGQRQSKGIRRNVWFDDRLERYISLTNGETWEHYMLESEGNIWPVKWIKKDGKPLHIPYIHFRNQGLSDRNNYGTSELAGGALGLINQINDGHYVLAGAGRMEGYRLIWLAGLVIPEESPGVPGKVKAGPGSVLWSENPEFKAGAIEAGNPEGVLAIQLSKVRDYGIMTRTPLHLLTGNYPSGDAIIRAEEPAKGKAESQVVSLKNSWVRVAHRAIEIWNAYGNKSLPENPKKDSKALIAASFAPVERRDPLSMSVIVNNLGDRISDEQALRMYGFTETEIEKNMQEKQAAAESAMEREITQFSRGVGRGTEMPGRGPDPEGNDDSTTGTNNGDITRGNADKSKGK